MNANSLFEQQYRNTKILFGLSLIALVGFIGLWWYNIYEDKEKELNVLVESYWAKAVMENYMVIIKDFALAKIQAKEEWLYRSTNGLASDTSNLSIELDSMSTVNTTLNIQRFKTSPNEKSIESRIEVSVFSSDSASKKTKGLEANVSQLQEDFDRLLVENNLGYINYQLIKKIDGETAVLQDSVIQLTNNEGQDYLPELQGIGFFLLMEMWQEFLFGFVLLTVISVAFYYALNNQKEQYQINQMKSDLVSNITHELRTPIFTVSAALEALEKFDVLEKPERTKEYLQMSQNELQRLSLLVDKVLSTSLHEEGKISLQKELVNLPNLVEGIKQSLSLQLEQSNAQMDIHVSTANIWANIDKVHLTNVIYNLIDNSLKYNENRPAKIKVEIAKQDNDVVLQVMDNGIGVPREYHHKIFDKFFRVPTGNLHNTKGYGLGLHYVANIIELHQGKIELLDSENGAHFLIILPKE